MFFFQGSHPPSRDISPNSNPNHPPHHQRQQIPTKHQTTFHSRSKYIKNSSHRPGSTAHLKRKKHTKQHNNNNNNNNNSHRNDIE